MHEPGFPAPPLRLRRAACYALWLALLLAAGCPANPGDSGNSGASGGGQSVTAPPQEARGSELILWADPVLVTALEGLAPAFRKASGGGSYKVLPVERAGLRAWAETGDSAGLAEPQVLLFAGRDDYLLLLEQQRLDEATARTFAGDRLVVLKPLKTTFVSPSVFDLYKSRFSELVVGDPDSTLLGLITDQALISDGVKRRIADRLRPSGDSRQPAAAPAGTANVLAITFASQSGGAQGAEPMLLIDSGLHEPVHYKAAAASGRGDNPAVVAFLRWLAEDGATQQALGGYGLLDRATALALRAPVAAGGQPLAEGTAVTAPAEPDSAADAAGGTDDGPAGT